MKQPLPDRRWAWLAVLVLAGACGAASAQLRNGNGRWRQEEEPRWLTMQVDQAAVGVFAEGYSQTTQSDGGAETRQDRWFIGPLIGLGLSGSIYHPNLLTYDLDVDGSAGWSEEEFSGPSSRTDSRLRFLGSFLGTLKFLDNKPLHGDLYGGYAQTYQDYDFFNRIYIDRWRYGGGLRYTTGPWAFSGRAYRITEDSTGYAIPMKSDTTTAAADVTHTRKSGSSALGGSVTSYTRTDYGASGRGQDYSLSASDTEDFGSRKQYHSIVNLGLNHLEYSRVPTDLYNAMANLRVDYTDRLTGQYTVNYARNTSPDADTDTLSGNANLQHRLYDSLTSQLNLQGYRYTASSGTAWQESWQIGGGPGFNYVKKLSDSSTLSAYEALTVFHTDVNSSGGVIPAIDEPHTFGTGGNGTPAGSITLRQPNVLQTSIVVTDTSHQPPAGFVRGVDYNVVRNGQLTLIQRLTGSRMPASVLVSYNFVASPPGSYETLNNVCGIRFDFFKNHLGIYARLNINQNYGGEGLTLQDLTDFVVGTEATWRFLRAGAELEHYDSNLSPFEALRFFQTLDFFPGENASLSLNLTETFLSYEQADREEQNYTAILRYSHNLTGRLSLNLDLGASQRIGPGVDQTLAVFRPQLQYTSGKLTATIGYDYGYDEYLNTQTRVRNMGFVRIRKDF